MDWSPQQQAALDAGRRWLDDPAAPQLFYLAGYAGTGKSTLAREFNEHVGGRAMAAAYTGKAASVMRRKGLSSASTIHRLIYTPLGSDTEAEKLLFELRTELKTLDDMPEWDEHQSMRAKALRRQVISLEKDAQPIFALKEESDLSGAPLLILDECSMVDAAMAEDLLSFGVKTLVLGDPAQLPPIKGTGYFTDRRPDALLTEVHRQAADNPILRLATLAREGRALPTGSWETGSGSAAVVDRVSAEAAIAADMVLTGTNKRRQAINRRHRELAGHSSPMPERGERLCCLKNDHEVGLQNGTLWIVDEPDADWSAGNETVYMNVRPEDGGISLGVGAEACLFYDDQTQPRWSSYQFFTWGSCLTVHKSQGSEFGKVVLFNDWPSRQSAREWLYTGITRAADHLTVVMS